MEALRKGVWWQSESNSEEKAGVKMLHAKTLQELRGRIRGGNAHILNYSIDVRPAG